ncbi:MAG: hypothetical protein JWO47_43 [Candidatus Saccharibacteria bacterium]|nr:hypothetical protein [Candidatus Saccharibacteria bacterium]
MEETKKLSRFRKSKLLAKGAWRSLMLDKELLTLPLIGFGASMLAIIPAVLLFVFNPSHLLFSPLQGNGWQLNPVGYVVAIVALLSQAIISAVVAGAVTHGAMERFKGNDPTVKSSIQAAFKRIGSLTVFTIFSFTIGFLISEIANRIPFLGGKIVLWLAGSAWNIASFFAIPVIVTSDTALGPIRATKKSTAVIKQAWGESLVLGVGIGLIAVFSFLGYIMVAGLLVGLSAGITGSGIVAGIVGGIAFLGLMAGVVLVSVLQTYVKASVYYYATTGISPIAFDSQLLRQAFTAKKARKLFAR